jgi:hypothetical protein
MKATPTMTPVQVARWKRDLLALEKLAPDKHRTQDHPTMQPAEVAFWKHHQQAGKAKTPMPYDPDKDIVCPSCGSLLHLMGKPPNPVLVR